MRTWTVIVVGTVVTMSSKAHGYELLTNGDFETGDVSGWTSSGSESWRTLDGVNPIFDIQASDLSYFALPAFAAPSDSRVLTQTVDLTTLPAALANDSLHVEAEAIFSPDAINLAVEFLDNSSSLILNHDLGTYGGISGSSYQFITDDLTIPTNARYVSFVATGILLQGQVIDAGFDKASMTVTLVPSPATAIVPMSVLFFARKRRRPAA